MILFYLINHDKNVNKKLNFVFFIHSKRLHKRLQLTKV